MKNIKKEAESLNFFRMLITKYPQEFVKNMDIKVSQLLTANCLEAASVGTEEGVGKTIVKVIVVPKKLVNIVVK